MTPYVFSILQTLKHLVRPMSKKHRLRTPFNSQHVKGTQTLVKCTRQHLYHIFPSILGKLGCKMSLLVICKILGLFFNTLTVNEKYFLCNSENLVKQIQTKLSKNKEISPYFPPFLKSTSNFKHFEKDDDPHS